MFKKLLLFVAFIAVGFTSYSQKETIINSLSVATQPLQSAVATAQSAWSNIPEPYKGYANLAVIGGVPTALMMFFAWTKQRAMQKVQQTQLQARQQISGLNAQMQSVIDERDAKIKELQDQLEATKNTTNLQSSLSEAQSLVAQKERQLRELQLSYETQIRTLQEQIAMLEDKLRMKPLVK